MSITATKFFSVDPSAMTSDVEDRFFTDLKTRNSTFKRTERDRFQQLDDLCIWHFDRVGASFEEVLDIGISSGSTTLALNERLRRSGRTPVVIGTDISLTAFLIRVAWGIRVLVDEAGHALQYEVLGRAVRAWTRRADYLTGMIFVRGLLRLLSALPIRRALLDRAVSREFRLVSPRLDAHPEVRVEQNDIFTPTDRFFGRFDFIRAANILNRGYFDERALRTALVNVASYLRGPGAWLLIARSTGPKTNGTLFRVAQDGHLRVACRIGIGSEIESLVLSTRLPSRGGPA